MVKLVKLALSSTLQFGTFWSSWKSITLSHPPLESTISNKDWVYFFLIKSQIKICIVCYVIYELSLTCPVTTVSNGLCQLCSQKIIFSICQSSKFLNYSVVCYDSKIFFVPEKKFQEFNKIFILDVNFQLCYISWSRCQKFKIKVILTFFGS